MATGRSHTTRCALASWHILPTPESHPSTHPCLPSSLVLSTAVCEGHDEGGRVERSPSGSHIAQWGGTRRWVCVCTVGRGSHYRELLPASLASSLISFPGSRQPATHTTDTRHERKVPRRHRDATIDAARADHHTPLPGASNRHRLSAIAARIPPHCPGRCCESQPCKYACPNG